MSKRSKSLSNKKSKTKDAVESYQHMMGSPMDEADHPANNLPTPDQGGLAGMPLGMLPGMAPGGI
jgi:hypothetical protein